MHSANCTHYILVVDHIFHIIFRSVIEVLSVTCDLWYTCAMRTLHSSMKCSCSCYNLVFFQRLFDVVGLSQSTAGDNDLCVACVKFFTGANDCLGVTLLLAQDHTGIQNTTSPLITTLLSVIVLFCCQGCWKLRTDTIHNFFNIIAPSWALL